VGKVMVHKMALNPKSIDHAPFVFAPLAKHSIKGVDVVSKMDASKAIGVLQQRKILFQIYDWIPSNRHRFKVFLRDICAS
jgi:hypothetical protein